MLNRIQQKRTARNANSRRKAVPRRRGMAPQWRPLAPAHGWKVRRAAAADRVRAQPLRGIHADLPTPPPVRRSFFRRLFGAR